MDARNSPRRGVTEHKGAAAAPPKVPDEDARELHMFVWSANASPVAERGLHVFGANSPPARHEFDPKELRLLVHQESDPALDAGERTSSLHMGLSFLPHGCSLFLTIVFSRILLTLYGSSEL
jgi:hypothetical protein